MSMGMSIFYFLHHRREKTRNFGETTDDGDNSKVPLHTTLLLMRLTVLEYSSLCSSRGACIALFKQINTKGVQLINLYQFKAFSWEHFDSIKKVSHIFSERKFRMRFSFDSKKICWFGHSLSSIWGLSIKTNHFIFSIFPTRSDANTHYIYR